MAKSFYEELANRNFYEKTASTHDQIKNALEAFSTEEMEAIAAELGLLSEKTAEAEEGATLESRVLDQVQKKENEDKVDESNDSKVEGGGDKTEESEATESKESEESKTKQEKKEIVNEQAAAVAGTDDGANAETTGDSSVSNNGGESKEASEAEQQQPGTVAAVGGEQNIEAQQRATVDVKPAVNQVQKDQQLQAKDNAADAAVATASTEVTASEEVAEDEKVAMVLAAYDLAAEKLAAEGYDLVDYVYSKVPDEKIAYQIAENAEKLAFITEQNSLKVADDIIGTMANLLDN